MHPRDAEEFEWDEANEDELWDHGIRPWEVEEVLRNRPVWAPNKKGRSGDYLMVGITDGGRKLTVPVKSDTVSGQPRPITSWPSSKAELSRYGKGERG